MSNFATGSSTAFSFHDLDFLFFLNNNYHTRLLLSCSHLAIRDTSIRDTFAVTFFNVTIP